MELADWNLEKVVKKTDKARQFPRLPSCLAIRKIIVVPGKLFFSFIVLGSGPAGLLLAVGP